MEQIDKHLSHKCLKICAVILAMAYIVLAISFLQLSFEAGDNQVLRLLGQQISGYESPEEHREAHISNQRYDKSASRAFVIISFLCIIVACLGVSATYSLEHAHCYFYGYGNSIFFMVFVSVASCYAILSSRIADDFSKECSTKTGLAY